MATPAQIEANRRNAQKSTGPKTPEGKLIVAQNSLVHGFRSKFTLLRSENPQEFAVHRSRFFDELSPQGHLETILTERIVLLTWQLFRASRIQSGTINNLTEKAEDDINSNVTKCLHPEKVERFKALDNSSDSNEFRQNYFLGDAAIKDFSNYRVIERLLMYERRIESSLYKTYLQLQQVQQRRRAMQKAAEEEMED